MRVEVLACSVVFKPDKVSTFDGLACLTWGGGFNTLSLFDLPYGVKIVILLRSSNHLLTTALAIVDVGCVET